MLNVSTDGELLTSRANTHVLTLSRTSLMEGSPLEEGGGEELQSATALQLCGGMGPRSLSLVSEHSPSPALAAPLLSDRSPLGVAAVGPGSGSGGWGLRPARVPLVPREPLWKVLTLGSELGTQRWLSGGH